MKYATIGTRLPPREDRDWVTTSELLNEVPITYRQIDYWCRTGLLQMLDDIPGSGWSRRLHVDQVRRARVIAALLNAGVQLPVVRDVVDEVTATGRAHVGHLTLTLDPDLIGDPAA